MKENLSLNKSMIPGCAKGIYIVEVRNGKFVKTGKFVL